MIVRRHGLTVAYQTCDITRPVAQENIVTLPITIILAMGDRFDSDYAKMIDLMAQLPVYRTDHPAAFNFFIEPTEFILIGIALFDRLPTVNNDTTFLVLNRLTSIQIL
jgi:hypothetical protein